MKLHQDAKVNLVLVKPPDLADAIVNSWLTFNVSVYNRGFWQFLFHGDHFRQDPQNSF